jgi:energy-coupling factor transport system substrate-specific component
MLRRNSFLLIPISLLGLFAFTWPLYISKNGLMFLSGGNTKWFAAILLPIAITVFILEVNYGLLDAKAVALLGVFTALICALRLLGAGAVGIEPIWFLLILIGRVFGPNFGFTLGITSIFTSALISGGVGPWLAFQMLAAAWVAMFAGFIPKKFTGKLEIFILCLYAIVATQLFGILMDLQLWPWLIGNDSQLSYLSSDSVLNNLHRFFIFHFATSLAWDIPRAILTVGLIALTGPAVLSSLKRAEYKLNKGSSARVMAQKAA